MSNLCVRCKGRGMCGGPCKILASIKSFQPKIEKEFSGSSPPEIFIGKYNYPNVFAGILSPAEFGETEYLSLPESWHEQGASIQDILGYRSRMIYSRFTSNIKAVKTTKGRFMDLMQEIAMADKHVDASFELEKKPIVRMELDGQNAMIGNPAPLKSARLESNPHVEKKVDYLTSDGDARSVTAINELYDSGIKVSSIIKVLSAGLLGLRTGRKLVPTRWAVTATDDTISKKLLEKIKYYQQISDILVFSANYLGNHYNILLIPGCWGFEVIEASSKGYFGQTENSEPIATWQDYEFYQGKKGYADSVTGAYYVNRLGVCEYLERVKRQASVLVMREVREEYWAPCGVGILREVTREAMLKKPEKFNSVEEALRACQIRFQLPISLYKNKSVILRENKEQAKLSKWF